jgi:hypothetical protein
MLRRRLRCAHRNASPLLDRSGSGSPHRGVDRRGLQKRQALCGLAQDLEGALPEVDRLGVGTGIVAGLPRRTRPPLVCDHPVMPRRQATTEFHCIDRPDAMGDGLIGTHDSLLLTADGTAAESTRASDTLAARRPFGTLRHPPALTTSNMRAKRGTGLISHTGLTIGAYSPHRARSSEAAQTSD